MKHPTEPTDRTANGDTTGYAAVRLFRLSQHSGPIGIVFTDVLRFAFGLELPRQVVIGAALGLPHGARGLTVHQKARIGDRASIHHNVTIGARYGGGKPPTVGNDVTIGAGACLLGDIRIGDRVTIGANAVVLCDVPDGATAVGVPARVLRG